MLWLRGHPACGPVSPPRDQAGAGVAALNLVSSPVPSMRRSQARHSWRRLLYSFHASSPCIRALAALGCRARHSGATQANRHFQVLALSAEQGGSGGNVAIKPPFAGIPSRSAKFPCKRPNHNTSTAEDLSSLVIEVIDSRTSILCALRARPKSKGPRAGPLTRSLVARAIVQARKRCRDLPSRSVGAQDRRDGFSFGPFGAVRPLSAR